LEQRKGRCTVVRKTAVGVLAAALLLSGLMAGVSVGGSPGVTQPTDIVLTLPYCARTINPEGTIVCRSYPLVDGDDGHSGRSDRFKSPVQDVDGHTVGHQYSECAETWGLPSMCTIFVALKAGPHTERGLIVLMHANHRVAVVGGTGAYQNARGDATLEFTPGRATLTLHLIP